jgi:hypothetical protein
MLISEEIIYLELPKTACSHIRNLLKHLVGGNFEGKHNRLPYQSLRQSKMVIGSIRNPWDWYVSIWAFGCDSKGILYDRLTSRKLKGNGLLGDYKNIPPHVFLKFLIINILKPIEDWKRLYSDAKNPELFREWLSLVLNVGSSHKYCFGDGYAFSPISSFAGIYTYYYMRLFSYDLFDLFEKNLGDINQLKNFDAKNNVLDETIRIENLENDLVDILKKLSFKDSAELRHEIRTYKPPLFKESTSQSNSSSRIRDIGYYYDPTTRDLVMEREELLIEKYGYSPSF